MMVDPAGTAEADRVRNGPGEYIHSTSLFGWPNPGISSYEDLILAEIFMSIEPPK